jgi:hypothetical protein
MKQKYSILNMKLNVLRSTQINRHEEPTTFHERVKKLTTTTFTKDEMLLINKYPKCNLHYKPKTLINRLALEAGTAISMIDTN